MHLRMHRNKIFWTVWFQNVSHQTLKIHVKTSLQPSIKLDEFGVMNAATVYDKHLKKCMKNREGSSLVLILSPTNKITLTDFSKKVFFLTRFPNSLFNKDTKQSISFRMKQKYFSKLTLIGSLVNPSAFLKWNTIPGFHSLVGTCR